MSARTRAVGGREPTIPSTRPAPRRSSAVAARDADAQHDGDRVAKLGRHASRAREIADMGRRVSRSHAGAFKSDTVASSDMGRREGREQSRAGFAAKTRRLLGRGYPSRPPPSQVFGVLRAGRGQRPRVPSRLA